MDPLGRYFRDLTGSDHEVLKREQEKRLGGRMKDGDREAREELIEHNLRLPIEVAKKYRGMGLDFKDLIQEGNLGLLRALDRYDPDRENRFGTYAYWWIRQSILQALNEDSRTVRVPSRMIGLKRKIDELKREYRGREGREPSRGELAEKLEVSEEKIRRAMMGSKRTSSLDKPLFEGEEGNPVLKAVEKEDGFSPEEEALAGLAEEKLRDLLDEKLTDRQKQIIKLRYGLEDYRSRSLEETGKVFGLSRERIRQLQKEALEKLKGADFPRRWIASHRGP